jgi:hypothetical protein
MRLNKNKKFITSGCTTPHSRRSSQRSSYQLSQRQTPLTTQTLPLVPPEPIEVEVPESTQIPEEVPNREELNQY